MTLSLKHAFTSGKSDGTDTTLVQPSNWNAEHTILMATGKILGRATAGTGAVEEISVTGTGSVALADSPVFTTQITAPLHIGGSGAASTLTLESTSGAGTTDAIILKTASQLERLRVDTNGRISIGAVAPFAFDGAITPHLMTQGTDDATSISMIGRWTNDASPPYLYFAKSRNATVGGNTVIQSGDQLGLVAFAGNDGTTMKDGAWIVANVDGTPGAGDMPTRLSLWTSADGSAVPTERLRVDSAGLLTAKYGFLSTHATVGMGYGTGAGGTVTQITSNTTAVTLDKVAGVITTKGDAVASNATVAFIVNSAAMAATDVPVVAIKSAGTSAGWRASVTRCVANNFTILLTNISAGTLTEAVDISFAIIKSVNS